MTITGELQHMGIITAGPTDPEVTLVIEGEAVVRLRPFLALARTTPMADEVTGLVKFQHRWSGHTALFGDWRVIKDRCFVARIHRHGSAMNDPDMVLIVYRYTNRRSENPVIW